MSEAKTIKAIIVDDEKNARENLRKVLSEYCNEIEIIGEAHSATKAILMIEKVKPNLIFLDIEMPGGNGFTVLEHFPKPTFKVIFVTAYDQYAIQAIRFSAIDYILKPINAIELIAAIKRLKETMNEEDQRLEYLLANRNIPIENKKIALPFSDKIEYIQIKGIIRCEGESNYTHFYIDDGRKLLISKTMAEFEEILDNHGFIRTHKTHLVNIKHICSFVKGDGGYLIMSDQSNVPVSRRKKETILSLLKNL